MASAPHWPHTCAGLPSPKSAQTASNCSKEPRHGLNFASSASEGAFSDQATVQTVHGPTSRTYLVLRSGQRLGQVRDSLCDPSLATKPVPHRLCIQTADVRVAAQMTRSSFSTRSVLPRCYGGLTG